MAVLNFDIKTVSLPSGEEAKAVFLTGSIDASTNQTFEGRLTDILSAGTRSCMLVLTNVKYINSTGLGTIVKCVDTFREKGGDIKLVGVPTKVIALFEMLGLLALFETHDTIEAAVSSFGKAKKDKAAAAPTVKFPLQFKHPVTGMGLNVSQPGRFKDPRSGDYFSVDQNGTIEFYEMSKVKMIEVKLPCDLEFSSSLSALATSLASHCELPSNVTTSIQRSIDEASSLLHKYATGANETCNIMLVADSEKLQIGIVNYGNALNIKSDDPSLKALQNSMDEVKHQVLPTRGYLLTMTKRAR
ncbi:MAG: STAS domain-containing protein [Planctomycetes bacterium]|nr:STAS domain-containing protein [Planctomycetota bacterium]